MSSTDLTWRDFIMDSPDGAPSPSGHEPTIDPSPTPGPTHNGSAGITAPKVTTSGLKVVTHAAENPTPTNPKLPKASTHIQWSEPLGLHIRDVTDEPLKIFRRAVGINSDLAAPSKSPGAAEQGRRQPTGVYKTVIERKRRLKTQHFAVNWALNVLHLAQVVMGATLTALGPNASRYAVAITALGALNTVIAGILALLKGQGMPNKLHRDEMEFRRLQDWIEETEALLVTGIIGRDNKDIGVLVESAFRKYESAQNSVENNRPDNYIPDAGSQARTKKLSGLGSAAGKVDNKVLGEK